MVAHHLSLKLGGENYALGSGGRNSSPPWSSAFTYSPGLSHSIYVHPVAFLSFASQPLVEHFFIFFPAAVVYRTNLLPHVGQSSSSGSVVPLIHSTKSQPSEDFVSGFHLLVEHFFILFPKRVTTLTNGLPHLGHFSSSSSGGTSSHFTKSQPTFFFASLSQCPCEHFCNLRPVGVVVGASSSPPHFGHLSSDIGIYGTDF